jgi:hypothetical protein
LFVILRDIILSQIGFEHEICTIFGWFLLDNLGRGIRQLNQLRCLPF